MRSPQRSLAAGLSGDGRPLLALTGTALIFSGGFAILQSISGQLLPHDTHALGMDAGALAHAGNSHLLRFMFHDRVAFGGTLLTIGVAYWWLAEFPLRAREAWAWWAYAVSGVSGFASFLAYLGYGYFDTWHGAATLLLLPVFFYGLWRARACAAVPLHFRQIWERSADGDDPKPGALGRGLLQLCAAGLVAAGGAILVVGMTAVFVPQDLTFMGLTRDQIRAISPMLVPVIAHDRAGFGGGLLSAGLLIGMIARHQKVTRDFLDLMAAMGLAGFGAALGVHMVIGYTDFIHLAPAYAGLGLFLTGLALCVAAYRRSA